MMNYNLEVEKSNGPLIPPTVSIESTPARYNDGSAELPVPGTGVGGNN